MSLIPLLLVVPYRNIASSVLWFDSQIYLNNYACVHQFRFVGMTQFWDNVGFAADDKAMLHFVSGVWNNDLAVFSIVNFLSWCFSGFISFVSWIFMLLWTCMLLTL